MNKTLKINKEIPETLDPKPLTLPSSIESSDPGGVGLACGKAIDDALGVVPLCKILSPSSGFRV